MLFSPQPCCLYLSLLICPPMSSTCRVLTELVSKMKDMQMDKSELGCLRAIVLFNPGKLESWGRHGDVMCTPWARSQAGGLWR